MASQTISEFPALPAGQVASDDLVPVVDVSDLASPGGTTKKTLVSSVQQAQNLSMGVFSVHSYGAVLNGVTDDHAAFVAADAAAVANGGGIVFLPPGTAALATTFVLSAGNQLIGVGPGKGVGFGSRINWLGASGFAVQVGNSASTLSAGNRVSGIAINIANTNAHGLTLYGTKGAILDDLYIEGQVGTTATIAVQIDGANIGNFFTLALNVTANHVFTGFVHTTTGSVVPTQCEMNNCSALCDDTTGSKGVNIQAVGGVGCGDGVVYNAGNMEHCKIGIYTNCGGSEFHGVRFENPQGTSEDVKFDTLARNNQIVGCDNCYTITNVSGSYTNQVLATSKDRLNVLSQPNILDDTTIKNLTVATDILGTPTIGASSNLTLRANGTAFRYIISTAGAGFTGAHVMQAGNGSAGSGGSTILYGHAHATHPGDHVAAISQGSGGKFRVNSSGLDGATDYITVDGTGLKVNTGFGCNGTTPQTAVASGGAAPAGGTGATAGAYDTAAHRDALITLVNTMRTALVACGILT